jgi:hypothetical protein
MQLPGARTHRCNPRPLWGGTRAVKPMMAVAPVVELRNPCRASQGNEVGAL